MHIYVYVCMYVCMYIYIYIYIYTYLLIPDGVGTNGAVTEGHTPSPPMYNITSYEDVYYSYSIVCYGTLC